MNTVSENLHQLSDAEMDAIMERIQSMMRLRDNAGASVGEIANAGEMIQKLLLKYNLSMSEIESHDPIRKEANDYTKSDRFDLGASSNYRTEWRSNLLNVVARTNFCRMVLYSRQKKFGSMAGRDAQAVLIGKPYNVQVTKELYEWLADQVNRLCTKAWTSYHRSGGEISKKIWKTSFFAGAVVEINARLVEQKRRAEAEDANVHALIVLSDEGLQKAYEKYYPSSALSTVTYEYHWFRPGDRRGEMRICQQMLKTGAKCGQEPRGWLHYRRAAASRGRSMSESAYEAGREAGRSVNLSPKRKMESGSGGRQLGG